MLQHQDDGQPGLPYRESELGIACKWLAELASIAELQMHMNS